MEIKLNDNAKETAFISVDYEEFNVASYSGVIIDINGKKNKINTGNFEKDYDIATYRASQVVDRIYNSSSVDNFISDSKRKKLH